MRAPEQGDAVEVEAARHSCTVPATPSNDCGFVVVLVVVTWSTRIVGIPAETLRRTSSSAGWRPHQMCACPGSAGGALARRERRGPGISDGAGQAQAHRVLAALTERMREVGLELHPNKTRIVYCKDGRRRSSYQH